MITLINNTIAELGEISRCANSAVLQKINRVKKSVQSKNPDLILSVLQKTGDLNKYYNYWELRSAQDPEDVKATLKNKARPIIEILIDLHVLKSINEPTKIVWANPNIINPGVQPQQHRKPESIENKKPKWSSQAGLADILGVSRQAVQKLCGSGKKFEPAQNEKGKINRWHPIVVQHIEDHKADNISKIDPLQKPDPEKTPAVVPAQVKNSFNMQITYEKVEHLTLKQIVEVYGGIQGFKGYMDALVKMSEWRTKENREKKERYELIEKEPTAKALFSIVNVMLAKTMNEYPSSIVDQLFAIAKGEKKTARIDAINLIQETLSKIIKDAKKELVRDVGKLEN